MKAFVINIDSGINLHKLQKINGNTYNTQDEAFAAIEACVDYDDEEYTPEEIAQQRENFTTENVSYYDSMAALMEDLNDINSEGFVINNAFVALGWKEDNQAAQA